MAFLFEKLDVYQKAVSFANKAFTLTQAFPRGQFAIADQLKRAALSIPLNIAEGSGRWHKGDKRQFYLISRGSAYECVAAAEICRLQALMSKSEHEELKADLQALCQMLTKLIQSTA